MPKTVRLSRKSSVSGQQKNEQAGCMGGKVLVDSLNRKPKSWACVGKDDAKRAHGALQITLRSAAA